MFLYPNMSIERNNWIHFSGFFQIKILKIKKIELLK